VKRTILSVLSGIAVGASGTFYLRANDPLEETLPLADERISTNELRLARAADPARLIERIAAGENTERSAIYLLAGQSDETDLRGMIDRLAQEPATATRRFALSVLFTRYAELDADAAIDALAAIREHPLAEKMGLAVLEVIGIDDGTVARVAAGLPGTDPAAFRVEAIAALAQSAPFDALQMALSTDSKAYRSHAVRRVARSWARQDAATALAMVALIQDDDLGDLMRNVVASEWARVEPTTLLTYLGGLTDRSELNDLWSTGAIRELTASYPQGVLEVARDLPRPFDARVALFAVGSWAQTDPLSAYAYAENLPVGRRREQLRQQIATVYAREDPDGALLWLDSVEDRGNELADAVFRGIAQQDPERALELALSETSARSRPWAISSIVMGVSYREPERMPQLASTVLAIEDVQIRDQVLQMLTSAWVGNDMAGALDWALGNAEALPNQTLREIARRAAQEDPATATQYVNRVPSAVRDTWITAVAAGYAAYDRQGALDWIGQYRGHSAYVPALVGLVEAAARKDPVAAGKLADEHISYPAVRQQVEQFIDRLDQ
jgi:hypothetical protein